MAWPNSQTRRVALVVQNAQVSGSGTHSSFPVLITADNLPAEVLDTDDANAPQSDGGDIRFASDEDGNTQLPFEIVDFTPTSGGTGATAEIWVKVDLNTASDTTFYMAWKTSGTTSAPAVTDANGRNAVWSDYLGVWHLQGTGTQTDATGNGNDLTAVDTPADATAPWGVSGGALDFDGSADVLHATITAVDVPIVLSCWFNCDAATQSDELVTLNENDTGDAYRLRAAGDAAGDPVSVTSRASGNENDKAETTTGFSATTWHLGVGVWAADDDRRAFIDGGSKGTSVVSKTVGSTTQVNVGAYKSGGSLFNQLAGLVDEARLRNSVLSDDWIATEYNNQSSAATFIVEGTPEDVAGGGGDPVLAPVNTLMTMGIGR